MPWTQEFKNIHAHTKSAKLNPLFWTVLQEYSLNIELIPKNKYLSNIIDDKYKDCDLPIIILTNFVQIFPMGSSIKRQANGTSSHDDWQQIRANESKWKRVILGFKMKLERFLLNFLCNT